jgi:hypothetical protein
MLQYEDDLSANFWAYATRHNLLGDLDAPYDARRSRPPVFKWAYADRNVLQRPDASAAERGEVLARIPRRFRHRWFGSMRSSQALAQSVFANLKVHGSLDALSAIVADDGSPLCGPTPGDALLEYPVTHLNEPRPTHLDVVITHASRYRVAVECKLSEREVGTCSRPRLGSDQIEYCDGTYSRQRERSARCALTEVGVTYWEHASKLFTWTTDKDLKPCPWKDTYQLIRNLLAICIGPDGELVPGHVVLAYDARNPAFKSGDALKAFQSVSDALHEPGRLRKCSWQSIVRHLHALKALPWLTEELADKYGF